VFVIAVDRSRLPVPGADPAFRFPEVSRRVLSNGLGVRTVEHRGVPVVSFALLLSSGSAADPFDKPGLAALTADMLDEGSGSRSALDIEDALSAMGAQFETEVGADATVLSLLALPRFADEALALLSDIVVRPNLAEDDFDRVRELRVNRLRQLRTLAPAVADFALARLLYAGHPYGRVPLGSMRGLDRTGVGDVTAFHHAVWMPSQVTIVAVGDATHDELFGAVEGAFGSWEGHPADGAADMTLAPSVMDLPAPERSAAPLAIVDRPGAAQSELRIGQVAVPRLTPDYAALLVLNMILGGQFVSRLNLNLREDKGFTYGVRSGFEFRRAPGPFVIQTAVQTGVTADAVREVLSEVRAITLSRPATPAELDLAKAALTRGYPRSFETAGQIARGLAQLTLYELPDDTLEQFVPLIRGVDLDAVAEAARRLDLTRMAVAVVGDREKVESSLTALGLGDPVRMSAEAEEGEFSPIRSGLPSGTDRTC
jgi:predicted Zn-dependent peptidase